MIMGNYVDIQYFVRNGFQSHLINFEIKIPIESATPKTEKKSWQNIQQSVLSSTLICSKEDAKK